MSDESIGRKCLPPVCLFFALALAISGFAVQSIGEPEPDMKLHRARVEGQEDYEERLEEELAHRQWARKALVVGLYGGALCFTAAAFWTMQPAGRRRAKSG